MDLEVLGCLLDRGQGLVGSQLPHHRVHDVSVGAVEVLPGLPTFDLVARAALA